MALLRGDKAEAARLGVGVGAAPAAAGGAGGAVANGGGGGGGFGGGELPMEAQLACLQALAALCAHGDLTTEQLHMHGGVLTLLLSTATGKRAATPLIKEVALQALKHGRNGPRPSVGGACIWLPSFTGSSDCPPHS